MSKPCTDERLSDADPTDAPEFKRVLGNMLKTPPVPNLR